MSGATAQWRMGPAALGRVLPRGTLTAEATG